MSVNEPRGDFEHQIERLRHALDMRGVTDEARLKALELRVGALESAAIEQRKNMIWLIRIIVSIAVGVVIKFAFDGGFTSVGS